MESRMNKLLLSSEAQNDLLEIREYISIELENPDAAGRTLSRITQRLRMLEAHGELGAPLRDGYRYLVCGNYLAFYRYRQGVVYVARILYGRRDYMRVLFEDEIED